MEQDLASEKYVSLTTYKRDGTTVSTPVWIADLGDGALGFTTGASSFKVKRISRDARVRLQPCNMKGDVTPASTEHSGTASVVTGADFDAVAAKVGAKYKFQYRLVRLAGKAKAMVGKGDADAGIVITLD